MRCSKAHINISAAMDGELDQAGCAELARHLESCPDCIRYQEDLEQCRVLLRDSECAPSAQFEWKVQLGISRALREGAAAQTVESSGRFWLPAGATALVTAAMVLAVGLWWLGGELPLNSDQGRSPLASGSQSELQVDASASLRALQQQTAFRPRVVNTMPEWPRQVRPDWRTPPSIQGQISTVNGLRMLPSEPTEAHLRYGFRNPGLVRATSDSNSVSPSPPKAR